MRRLCLAVLAVVALAAIHRPARAQQTSTADPSRTRYGFWFGAGVGGGVGGVESSDLGGITRNLGLSGYARLGTTLSPHVLLGVEGNGWRHRQVAEDAPEITSLIGTVHGTAYWYPSAAQPYFLKVGVGLFLFKANDQSDGDGDEDNALRAKAFSGQVGAGYELRVTRDLSLVPFANLVASFNASLEQGNEPIGAADVGLTLFQFGVGVTWH